MRRAARLDHRLQIRMREDIGIVRLDRRQHHVADHGRIERARHDLLHARRLLGVIDVGGQHQRRGVGFALQLRRTIAAGVEDVRRDDAGAQHRYADVVLRQIRAHRFRHADDRVFGRVVDAEARNRDVAGHRRGIDDMATFAVRLDAIDERLHAVDDAVEIDAHHPIPVFVTHRVEPPPTATPALLHTTWILPNAASVVLRGAFHRIAVGHVDLQRDDLGVRLGELGLHAVERVLLDVGDRHFHAGRGERPRHRESHAACAAGNECHFPVTSFMFFPSMKSLEILRSLWTGSDAVLRRLCHESKARRMRSSRPKRERTWASWRWRQCCSSVPTSASAARRCGRRWCGRSASARISASIRCWRR